MICRLVFNLTCKQPELSGSSVNESCAQDTEQKSVQIACNSYEDPNVDDMKPSSNNRDGSEDSGGSSTGAVLD